MPKNRLLTRSASLTAAVGLLALVGAGTASAHVSAQPEEAPQGGHAKIAFRVPNERPDSGTIKIKVELPLDHPLSSVRTKPMPGWEAQVERVKLDKPVDVEGAQVTEAVASITWTAQPGARIGPDEFDEFEATLGTLPSNTDQLVLPTEQTYESGEVVRWDAPPTGGAEPEHPAPTLKLVESEGGHSHGGGHSQDGGPEAGAAPAEGHAAPPHAAAEDGTARLLGGAGLAVGALGLGVGAGALLRSRNSGARSADGGKDQG